MNTILIISLLSLNIETQMSYQIATLPESYEMEFQNQLSWLLGCHGNQILSQIRQHFIFASISVAIATTIISITLYLVPHVVNRHFCFRNQHQMCAYFMGFHGNISLYIMTMKCFL